MSTYECYVYISTFINIYIWKIKARWQNMIYMLASMVVVNNCTDFLNLKWNSFPQRVVSRSIYLYTCKFSGVGNHLTHISRNPKSHLNPSTKVFGFLQLEWLLCTCTYIHTNVCECMFTYIHIHMFLNVSILFFTGVFYGINWFEWVRDAWSFSCQYPQLGLRRSADERHGVSYVSHV